MVLLMIKYLFILFFLMSIRLIGVTNLIKLRLIGAGVGLILVEIIFRGISNIDPLMLGFNFIVDSLGLRLIILSVWIILLMYLSRYRIVRFNEFFSIFRGRLLALLLVLVLTFSLRNYLLFYFFFEVSLIPTLLVILGWGYQPERLQAGVYFIFYTLRASLPLLVILMGVSLEFKSLNFIVLSEIILGSEVFTYVIIFIGITAFLVKLPIFLTHLWLPKAHVEAPVAGSMILAGVLLKLGGYGLMRLVTLFYPGLIKLGGYFIGLRLMGTVYVGLVCCRVNDFKALVAYSSVAHIGIVISGIVCYYIWGYNGGLIIIVGHGLASSGLFCIVNIYYERVGSRRFYLNKGFLLVLPIFSLIIFLLRAANIAAPPTINLISEIFLMSTIIGYDIIIILIFPLGSFLGAVFTLFIYSYSQHGKIYYLVYGVALVTVREVHVVILHIFPVNLLILSPSFFIRVI